MTHIAAGYGHSLIASNARQVYGFGLNRCGQSGGGSGVVFDSHDDQVYQLACGREHSHIIVGNEKERRLLSFGNNMYGQLGLGKSKSKQAKELVMQTRPQAVETCMNNIHGVACGLDHTVFLAGGTVDHASWELRAHFKGRNANLLLA